ncbi:polysaccharide deacetylase family protein [Clostridium sediminicola]|uniref:polysaccharide deacetylase family protein n=1 Tax=Clostridium sediminicola TaxID=3114879 RepID=UPI0031F26926
MKNSINMTKSKIVSCLLLSLLILLLLSGCTVTNNNQSKNNNVNEKNINSTDNTQNNSNSKNVPESSENEVDNEAPEDKTDNKDSTDKPAEAPENEKIAYLTFDDGPSKEVTPEILKILDDYNVKATFFVMGLKAERYPELILEEHNKGHIVANHTYGHNEEYLYANTDNFMNDIYKAEDVLKNIIPGYDYKLIRFPQGAFHKKKAAHREAVSQAGYHYVDWNCINGDYLASTLPTDQIIEQVKETYRNQKKLIVLMHDASPKTTTAEALPEVIEFLRAEGYTFKTLEKLTK